MIRLLSCAAAIAFIATVARASPSDYCSPLDEAEKLVLEGFGGTPFQELTSEQVQMAQGVLLNPGNPANIAALSATRVIVSVIKTGDDAVIFVVDGQACAFGFMPAGTVKLLNALEKEHYKGAGEGI